MGIMQIYQVLFPQLDDSQLEEIYREIDESRRFGPTYLLMLFLACMIALLGLLTNSPAVIIGAMLISPLMGPILCCGLALTLADWQLGKKALKNVLLSVIEAITIAAIATWLSPLKELTPEILARTHPNLMDLLIAFFSGIAGTVALVKWQKGLTIIPGVAIATAIMPPLAVVGYGLSTMQWQVASGGFMLFFTNLMSIIISADLIFLVAGFRPRQQMVPQKHRLMVRNRILVASIVLILMSIPLIHTLSLAAGHARLQREISRILQNEMEQKKKSRIVEMNFDETQDPVPIEVIIHTINRFDKETIDDVSRSLSARIGKSVRLDIQQIIVEEAGVGDTARKLDILKGGGEAVREYVRAEIARMPLRNFEQRILDSISQAARETFSVLPDIRLQQTQIVLESTDRPMILRCAMESAQPVTEQGRQILQNLLSTRLARPVRIEGESRLRAPEYSLVLDFSRFKKGTIRLTLEIQQKLADFYRRLDRSGIDFRMVIYCEAPSPEESEMAKNRIQAIKEYFLHSLKVQESVLCERVDHSGKLAIDPPLPAGAVLLEGMQIFSSD